MSEEKKAYKQFFYEEQNRAKLQAKKYSLNLEEELAKILRKNSVHLITPKLTGGGPRIYTPHQLSGVVSNILEYENPMAAYMVLYSIGFSIRNLKISFGFQGDLMMSFEKIRAIDTTKAEKGAELLAHSLYMMPNIFMGPSLKRARKTYENIGVPYTTVRLSDGGIQKLLEENFVAESDVAGNAILWDVTIKSLVRSKLFDINSYVARIIGAGEPVPSSGIVLGPEYWFTPKK